MIEHRPEVERAIRTIVGAQSYRVQLSANEHAGRKFYLNYLNAAGAADRIEVDINFLFRLPIADPEARALWQPGGIKPPECRVVGREELWIGKLCALLDRCAPRDLYDTTLLFEHEEGASRGARFKALFVAMSGTLDHPMPTYGRERLERTSAAAVEEQLHPMLTLGDRPSVGDLIDAAWRALEPLVALTDPEQEYVERLQIGELRPELLFPEDVAMRQRLARHPALLWKAQNAREHQRRAGSA